MWHRRGRWAVRRTWARREWGVRLHPGEVFSGLLSGLLLSRPGIHTRKKRPDTGNRTGHRTDKPAPPTRIPCAWRRSLWRRSLRRTRRTSRSPGHPAHHVITIDHPPLLVVLRARAGRPLGSRSRPGSWRWRRAVSRTRLKLFLVYEPAIAVVLRRRNPVAGELAGGPRSRTRLIGRGTAHAGRHLTTIDQPTLPIILGPWWGRRHRHRRGRWAIRPKLTGREEWVENIKPNSRQ